MFGMPTPSFQLTVDVKFEKDLPNGPYGEVNPNGSATVYVPPKSTYQDVQTAILDAWKESRKGMAKAFGSHTEEWSIGTFKCKGGGVDLEKPAVEGSHNVELIYKVRLCICTIM
tara:strand:- start:920 stop:1261 length:342 start_codon:yes stop_codon:yes gene_type:complete